MTTEDFKKEFNLICLGNEFKRAYGKHYKQFDDSIIIIFLQKSKFGNQFYFHLKDCGNTVSSTIPIALYHSQKDGLLISDKNILLAGFGVGYSWAGCVLKT